MTSNVEFTDVSDLHAVLDAARPLLSLPSTSTSQEIYHAGFEAVLQQITTLYPDSTDSTKAHRLRLAVLQDIDLTSEENEATANLAHRVGAAYLMHGKLLEAKQTLLLSLGGLNKVHGELHPEVLKCCGTLTTVYERMGDYKTAIAMASRVLKAQEEQLGSKHRETLTSVTNVAGLLQHVGDVKQAEDMYIRALAELQVVCEEEHVEMDADLDYLTCLGNYAVLLEKKPDANEESQSVALSYYKRAVRGKERVLGKENPDTLRSMSNLAMLLEAQGNVDEAKIMFAQCLELRTVALGKNHVETLSSRAAVAGCLLKNGAIERACNEYQLVLTGYITTLGPSSPMSIQAMADLAYCLMAHEKMEDALEMYKKVTALRLKNYGACL